jgi:hypothetical protein
MLLAIRKFDTQMEGNVDRVVMGKMKVSNHINLRHPNDACNFCWLVPAINEKMIEYEGKVACITCARKRLSAKERAAGR